MGGQRGAGQDRSGRLSQQILLLGLWNTGQMLYELPGWSNIITIFYVLINSVGPDLGLNCSQMLSEDDNSRRLTLKL